MNIHITDLCRILPCSRW